MAYNELIKNFQNVRDYMQDFFIYGFHTRKDFDKKSGRSYDNERRRIQSWLGDSLTSRKDASGKVSFVSVDSRVILHNPLYKALKATSFTDKDITLHFYILDILSDGVCRTVTQILKEFNFRCDQVLGGLTDPFIIDEKTLRIKLNDYVKLGILKKKKQGNKLIYSRNDTAWDIDAWKDTIAFASEAMPLGIVGSCLLDKYHDVPGYFSFKHHYLLHAMDSEILSQLLLCRKERRNAEITFTTTYERKKTRQALVYPLKIYISTQNGRENLLAYNHDDCRPRMYRLDRIKSVRIMKDTVANAALLDQEGKLFAEHLWGTSSGIDGNRKIHHLEMQIHAGQDESFIVDRLHREKRNGTITQLNGETWLYSTDVYDAREMLPWIRSFTGRIVSLECSDPYVIKRVYDDFEDMYSMYGTKGEDSESDIQ